jgi:glutamyl-tRNA(Gln) amidotransferase subunit E
MPLIETVTYPDMFTPDELREAAEYIRFLNRSTGKVRTGIGSGREDVNVSCKGGTRVELKGVAHNKWIPELSHNEAFRQWSLLHLKEDLNNKISNSKEWKIKSKELNPKDFNFKYQPVKKALKNKEKIIAINLPGFKGCLSHFTQPGKMFADEIEDRLAVIACLERPNMSHSEEIDNRIESQNINKIQKSLKAKKEDAQIILWGPKEDIDTALETVEERCQMAFEGVPNETRKTLPNGTTIFERVLPGPDRMYPDTDSAPIPLDKKYIENIRKQLPTEIVDQYNQLKKWNVPEDAYYYIFSKNLFPVIKKIVDELNFNPKFVGTFFGHSLKFVEGHYSKSTSFSYEKLYNLFEFISKNNLRPTIAKRMLPYFYKNTRLKFSEILDTIEFRKLSFSEIQKEIPKLNKEYDKIRISKNSHARTDWIMGKLHKKANGNISLEKLKQEIEKQTKK